MKLLPILFVLLCTSIATLMYVPTEKPQGVKIPKVYPSESNRAIRRKNRK